MESIDKFSYLYLDGKVATIAAEPARSEVLVVDVGRDHVSDLLASPLRSHVANALHSDELEAVVHPSET